MTGAALRIANRDARRLWLWSLGLSGAPTGALDLGAIIDRLGFVQIDTIRNVTRAQNHILWSRNNNYREGAVWKLLESGQLFEHFTHDASLIPMTTYPLWQRQFRRLGTKTKGHSWYAHGLDDREVAAIIARIRADGPLSTHAFDTKVDGAREMWARPPHKKALDLMWYDGTLATRRRENFVKFYDLGERVFPADPAPLPADGGIDVLCRAALDRLSFGSTGEIQRFWDAMTAPEAKGWAEAARDLVPVEIGDAAGGWQAALAPADIEARLAAAPAPTARLRILNPFDPAIRDRARLERLFGFDYRNEMFVPAARRRWGYYVYPLLEGDRFVGRLEARGDRRAGRLHVTGFWPEAGVKWTGARETRLAAELARFGRFAGLCQVVREA